MVSKTFSILLFVLGEKLVEARDQLWRKDMVGDYTNFIISATTIPEKYLLLQCGAECMRNASCRSFSTQGGVCTLISNEFSFSKGNNEVYVHYDQEVRYAIPVLQNAHLGCHMNNQNLRGDHITQYSHTYIDNCIEYCLSVDNCQGSSFDKSTSLCILIGNLTGTITEPNMYSWTKTC